MLKKLFAHSFLYAIGPQVPKLANLLVLPIITAYLEPVDYGIYGTLIAYTGLLSGLRMLGFDVLLVNSFFKKNKWQAYWNRYLGGLYFYNILFVGIYIVFLQIVMPKEVGNDRLLIITLIIIPNTLFHVLNVFGGRYFQLAQKPQFVALVTAVVGSISVFINLYTIAYLELGYIGWFISTAIGGAITFVFYYSQLVKRINVKPILTRNKNFWRKSLRVALPTIPHNYSTYLLNSSDRMVMDQLGTPIGQIGRYNLAYIFGGYMELFGNAVGMAVGPYISALHSKKTNEAEKQVQTLIFFLQVCFITLCVLISIWSKEIFYLLINNDELNQVYNISVIIIMGYAYRPLYWASVNKLQFYEYTGKLWRISFVAGVINVVLNLIFIPIYGIMAAALSTMLSLIYMGVAPYYIKEYKKLNNQKFYPIYWMISVVLLTGIVYSVIDSNALFKGALSIIFITLFVIYFVRQKGNLNKIKV